jgi:hypothetical protein
VIKTRAGNIEILGTGQQFVAAGTHPSGARIEWEWPATGVPTLTAEQFAALVDALAKQFAVAPVVEARLKTERQDGPAIDCDEETAVQRAIEFLKTREPAIEGKTGDDWTYKTVCKVKDLGVPPGRMLDVLNDWNSRCSPAWDLSDLEAKVERAFRYGQNAPGSQSVEAVIERCGFEPVPGAQPVEQPQPQQASGVTTTTEQPAQNTAARFVTVLDIDESPDVSTLLENAIPEGGLFAIGAVPGRSKSYAALGLCYAIAINRGEFLGRAVPKAMAAVYVDVERLATTVQRLKVWAKSDGLNPNALPLYVTDGFMLNDPTSVRNLIDAVRDLEASRGRKVGLVIVDALASSIYGAELNSSGTASLAGHMLRKLRDEIKCTVGVVAHSPKSGDETIAGSMQFDAIFDASIFMRSEDEGASGCMYVKKSNGLPLEEHEKYINWKRELVSIRRATDDRLVKAHRLVASDAQQGGSGSQDQPKPTKPGKVKKPTLADLAWTALCNMTFGGMPIDREKWLQAVIPHAGAEKSGDRRDMANRAIKEVLASGKARVDENNKVQVLS